LKFFHYMSPPIRSKYKLFALLKNTHAIVEKKNMAQGHYTTRYTSCQYKFTGLKIYKSVIEFLDGLYYNGRVPQPRN